MGGRNWRLRYQKVTYACSLRWRATKKLKKEKEKEVQAPKKKYYTSVPYISTVQARVNKKSNILWEWCVGFDLKYHN